MTEQNNKFFFLFIISILLTIFSLDLNFTNIPELLIYNNQTLKLLVPSKRCKPPSYKTLFLISDMRNNSNEIEKKYKIIKYKNLRNSFVTFFSPVSQGGIYKQYINLLESQGIIKSNNIYSDNNFFLVNMQCI